jgi:ferritin
MKDIKLLVEHIEEELEDACTYAELALEYKHKDQDMAQMFYKLSTEEMNHKDMLHNQVTKLIAEHRRTTGEPPKEMMAVYDFMHKRFMDKAEKILNLQNLFRK